MLAISSLEIVALEIAVRPAGTPSPCVALDERCCTLLLKVGRCVGDVVLQRHVVGDSVTTCGYMSTSRDTLFRVHEANHFVTS